MLWEAWADGLSTAPPEVIARAFIALGVVLALDQATRRASNVALLEVVRAELWPWLLGDDPLELRRGGAQSP